MDSAPVMTRGQRKALVIFGMASSLTLGSLLPGVGAALCIALPLVLVGCYYAWSH